jgi:TonB family protein
VPPAHRESMARRVAGTEEKKVNCSSVRRHARPRWIGLVIYACLLIMVGLLAYHPAGAQAGARKIKTRVEPVYPELAKKNNISGSARVELLIAPDGKVKDVRVLGGNPVLVQAVVTAVMKWKYEPAAEESTVVVKFDFASP